MRLQSRHCEIAKHFADKMNAKAVLAKHAKEHYKVGGRWNITVFLHPPLRQIRGAQFVCVDLLLCMHCLEAVHTCMRSV